MLVVDDFGIKYIGQQHANHLIGILKEFYEVEVDWDGSLYAKCLLGGGEYHIGGVRSVQGPPWGLICHSSPVRRHTHTDLAAFASLL